jgi:hypothetical protein
VMGDLLRETLRGEPVSITMAASQDDIPVLAGAGLAINSECEYAGMLRKGLRPEIWQRSQHRAGVNGERALRLPQQHLLTLKKR